MLLVKLMKIQEYDEVHLNQVPGMLLRFSYVDLKAMTNNFSDELGARGFNYAPGIKKSPNFCWKGHAYIFVF